MLQPIKHHPPNQSLHHQHQPVWSSFTNPKSQYSIHVQQTHQNKQSIHKRRFIRFMSVINCNHHLCDNNNRQQNLSIKETVTDTITTTFSTPYSTLTSSVCDDCDRKCIRSNTKMRPKIIETPTLELYSTPTDEGEQFSLENSILSPESDDQYESWSEDILPNRDNNITANQHRAKYYPDIPKINNEANDQINLHQVAIDEAASEQSLSLTSPSFSLSLSSSLSPPPSSHQHHCDHLQTKPHHHSEYCPSIRSPHPPPPSSSSSPSSTSSSLSISSILNNFTNFSHGRQARAMRHKRRASFISSAISFPRRVSSLLCLLILFSYVPAMSLSAASTCCFPVLSLFLSLFCSQISRHPINCAGLLIGLVLLTTTVKVDALSSQTNQHSMHVVNSMPDNSDNVHRPVADSTDTPISAAELEMLKVLGFDSRPNPQRKHKVPQYMLDLYFWFRQTQLASNREKQRIREEAEEQARELNDLRSPITALTHTDLDDVHRYQEHLLADLLADEEEARFVKMIHKHHRLPKQRQPAQPPRVSLRGPVNTILSHKLKDHDDYTVDRRAVPIRRKRDTASSTAKVDPAEEQLLVKQATNEAHLTFDLHLPSGEHLKGGELRLYRHGVEIKPNKRASSADETRTTHSSGSANSQSLNNYIYLPFHWSVRWKSQKNSLGFTASQSSLSESSAKKNLPQISASDSVNEEQFLQRISVYHLLRPISELHDIRSEHHAKQNGTESVRLNINRFMRLIDAQVIDVRQSGWLSFDIFPAVSVWTAHPGQNYGLLVTLTDVEAKPSQHGRLIVVNKHEQPPTSSVQSFQHKAEDEEMEKEIEEEDKHEHWHRLQPHVVTFSANEKHFGDYVNQFGKADYDSNRLKREWRDSPGPVGGSGLRRPSGRRSNRKSNKKQQRPCFRQPLFFDFNSVGWNEFVVAPPGFQTYFCSGSCTWPMNNRNNYTNHATIQAILNSHNPQTMPSPCCVPTDLTPNTLLTVDNNGGIHLRTFSDMVVEGCGCR